MNRLHPDKRKAILQLLVEGSSLRSIARVVGCSRKTVTKLMREAGDVATQYHDEHVRDLQARRVECDELWAFCYTRTRKLPDAKSPPPEAGDIWTWTAIDPDSKLLISYLVGSHEIYDCLEFMEDVSSRLANRVQLTTDGYRAYPDSVDVAFAGQVDYAKLVKVTDDDKMSSSKVAVLGDPDPKFISTSIVERMNLTIRMGQRRYTRHTNGFSKSILNHRLSLALHILHYNFCRPHRSLANPYPRSPAMAAGLADRVHKLDWLIDMVDAVAPKPRRPQKYRKRREQ